MIPLWLILYICNVLWKDICKITLLYEIAALFNKKKQDTGQKIVRIIYVFALQKHAQALTSMYVSVFIGRDLKEISTISTKKFTMVILFFHVNF